MGRLIYALVLMFVVTSSAFPKEWNGIIPCVSSRLDAERILGEDTVPHTDPFGSYWYKGLRVYIHYLRTNEKAPKQDVVQMILVYPKKSVLLSKYIRNIPNFSKEFTKTTMDPKVSHLRYLAHYFNDKEAFEIVVQKNDKDKEIITAFGYYGQESDCSKWLSVAQGEGELRDKEWGERMGSRLML